MINLKDIDIRHKVYSSFAGAILAATVVVGRWSPDRFVTETDIDITAQPRTYLVLSLILIAFFNILDQGHVNNQRVRRPLANRSLLYGCLCLFFMILTIGWAKDLNLAIAKALELGMLIVTVSACWSILKNTNESWFVDSFWNSILGFLLVLLFIGLIGGGGQDRLAVLGGGPNTFGRLMSILCIVCVTRAVNQSFMVGWSVLALGSLSLVILSGSRGALIAIVCALLAFVIIQKQRLRKVLQVAVLFCLVGIAILALTPLGRLVIETYQIRIIELTMGQMYTSSRDTLATMALEVAGKSPIIGVGLSGYYVETGVNYPHNVFLELLAEGGAIGCGLFILMLGASIRTFWRKDSFDSLLSLNILVLILIAAQFSGDLYDSRLLFYLPLFAGLVRSEPSSFVRNDHSLEPSDS